MHITTHSRLFIFHLASSYLFFESQNKEVAALLVCQANPVGDELSSYVRLPLFNEIGHMSENAVF